MGAVETVLWFPRSVWARGPSDGCGQGVHSSGSFRSTGAAHGAVAVDQGVSKSRNGGSDARERVVPCARVDAQSNHLAVLLLEDHEGVFEPERVAATIRQRFGRTSGGRGVRVNARPLAAIATVAARPRPRPLNVPA